ncbi:hypothetical protein BC827DRAFT_865397 [Russula dissimulans]|nr:hypothetical protein BC827DRAFT_865397 [Russula dissimulans]
MSVSICRECGHQTEWAQDIGSAVCTQCGTLADSSQQSALTSPLDFINDTTYAPSKTLKSIRRNAAWDLPGQGANSRNERNKSSTHALIRTLSDRLGHRGAAIRAQAIFDSTMQRTSTRWGKAAKLAAGAAVVFAMREQGRGDRTHHVALPGQVFHLLGMVFLWPSLSISCYCH